MPREMIEAIRDEHVLVDVKRRRDSLGEYICDVIIGVASVIKFRSIRSLPLLCLHDTLSVWRMKNKALELHLADSFDCRSDFKRQIAIGLVRIRDFNKSHFRIEVRPNFPSFESSLYPIRAVGQRSADITVPAGFPGRLRARHMRIHQPIPEESQARIDPSSLIEAIQHVARPLIDAHHTYIRSAPQRFL